LETSGHSKGSSTKSTLSPLITALQGEPLSIFTINERLRWTDDRHTKKLEDQAYCVLVIFGVFIPLIYGEGENTHTSARREIDIGVDGSNTTVAGMANPSAVVPFGRDADFVERETILDHLQHQYAVPGSRIALVGLGGVE